MHRLLSPKSVQRSRMQVSQEEHLPKHLESKRNVPGKSAIDKSEESKCLVGLVFAKRDLRSKLFVLGTVWSMCPQKARFTTSREGRRGANMAGGPRHDAKILV